MTYRKGIVQVSMDLMEAWDIPLASTNLQGQLQAEGVLERIEKKLLLPDWMHVEGVYFRWGVGYWELLVSSPTFDDVPDGEIILLMQLVYQRIGDEVELVRIDWSGRGRYLPSNPYETS